MYVSAQLGRICTLVRRVNKPWSIVVMTMNKFAKDVMKIEENNLF